MPIPPTPLNLHHRTSVEGAIKLLQFFSDCSPLLGPSTRRKSLTARVLRESGLVARPPVARMSLSGFELARLAAAQSSLFPQLLSAPSGITSVPPISCHDSGLESRSRTSRTALGSHELALIFIAESFPRDTAES